MKKKNVISENFLEQIPLHKEGLKWSFDDKNLVVLEVENKGFANRIAQLIIRKPKISYIHLDENGSFIWPLIDGERNLVAIGKEVEAHFGEAANPLYERLAQFFKVLETYNFITWKK